MGEPITTPQQAERAVGQLYSVTAQVDGQTVGMARLLGDGAVYW